jgi:hypothetical protein
LPILADDIDSFPDRETILTATHEKYDARGVTDGQYYYVRNIRQVDATNNSGNPTGYVFPQAALNADQYTGGNPWFNRSFDAIKADDSTPQYELLRQILEGDLPEDELYDLDADLWCTINLAADPAYASIKAKLRGELAAWRVYTEDYNADPSELTRRTARYVPLPILTTTDTDNFNTGSGGLNAAANWTTLVSGNSAADFNINSGTVESPAGPAPLVRYDSAVSLAAGEPFTVSVDVGFSATGVGAGIAFGITQEPDLEYSYWQFLLADGRSTPGGTDKDVNLRKMSDSGTSAGAWLIKETTLDNYPNGFSPAPTEFFRIEVSGQAGSAIVDLRIFNPDGSVYYTQDAFNLGEDVPAASEFGITTWSSANGVFDNFVLETN